MKRTDCFKILLAVVLLCLFVCCPAMAQEAPPYEEPPYEEPRYTDEELKQFPSTFFPPTDNYLAVLKGSIQPISFFAVHWAEQPFDGRTLKQVAMTNGENIQFTLNEVQISDISDRMGSRSLLTDASFPEAGRFEFDRIDLLFTDGSRSTYPIGRFVIEVFDDVDSGVLNTYSTVAMTSNNTYLPCEYIWTRDGLEFAGLELDLAAKAELEFVEESTCPYEGEPNTPCFVIKFRLKASYPTFYHFILPRVCVMVDGEEQHVYPKFGCYCGGLFVSENLALESYAAWHMSKAL